jgi:hypothetical protein
MQERPSDNPLPEQPSPTGESLPADRQNDANDANKEPGRPAPSPRPPVQYVHGTSLRCVGCGYDISGTAVGGHCPECGIDIATSLRGASLPTSGKAVASMILGICSIAIGCMSYGIVSIVCAPLAIIFASHAYRDVKAGEVNVNSRPLAMTGLITGIVGCVLALAGLAFIGMFIYMIVYEF